MPPALGDSAKSSPGPVCCFWEDQGTPWTDPTVAEPCSPQTHPGNTEPWDQAALSLQQAMSSCAVSTGTIPKKNRNSLRLFQSYFFAHGVRLPLNMLKYCTFLYLQPCREREEVGMFVRGRISNPVVTCRCHSVGLVLGPSPANVSLQVGLRQAWCFPQCFPPCWESSTAPGGFPAATEGSALGWLRLGAGHKPRGWTGRTAQCWNPAGMRNSSSGCTGNTRIHHQLSLPWDGLLHSTLQDPCSALLPCRTPDLQDGREALRDLSPSQKNCPEHP